LAITDLKYSLKKRSDREREKKRETNKGKQNRKWKEVVALHGRSKVPVYCSFVLLVVVYFREDKASRS
jgi:hypothetical protein